MGVRTLNVRVKLDGTDEANRKLGVLDKKGTDVAKRMAAGFKKVGQALTLGVTLPILAVGTAVAKMGIDVAESQSLVEVSFGRMTEAARTWSETTSAAIIQTKFDVQEQAAVFFNIARGMGLAEEASFDLATAFTEMSADFASFFNLRPEEAMTKLRGAITGEFEPLKQLGIVLNVATIEAQALKDGLIGLGEEMDTATRVQATYNAIIERAGVAMGDVARTADGTANRIRALQADLKEAGQVIGLELLPVVTELIETLAPPLIDAITDVATAFSEMDEEERKAKLGMIALGAITGPVVVGLSEVAQGIIAITLVMQNSTRAAKLFAGALALLKSPITIALGLGIGAGVAIEGAWADIERTAAGVARDIEARRLTSPEGMADIAAQADAERRLGLTGDRGPVLTDLFAARDPGMLGPQPITPEQIEALGVAAEAAAATRSLGETLLLVEEEEEALTIAVGGATTAVEELTRIIKETEQARVQAARDAAERVFRAGGVRGVPTPTAETLKEELRREEALRVGDRRRAGLDMLTGVTTRREKRFPFEEPADPINIISGLGLGALRGGGKGFGRAAGGITSSLIAAGSTLPGAAGLIGGIVGELISGLFKKRRAEPVIEPIPVKIVNFDTLAQLLNITRGQLVAGSSMAIEGLTQRLRIRESMVGI